MLIVLGLACSPAKKTMESPKSTKPMVWTTILELQSKGRGSETTVKLLNMVRAGGYVKIIPDEPANFEFRFVDSQSHTIASVYKQINLTTVYEYVDDNGHLQKKVMDGEPVVVPVRINYQPEMKKLVVYQMIKENYEPLATFLLQEKTQ